MQRELRECNQVALILPDYFIRRFAGKLKYKSENMYVGKEDLIVSIIGFTLRGYVPIQVYKKVKTVEWAGIWDRWRKLVWNRVVHGEENRNKHTTLHRPTMSGNMLIIFVLLFTGQITSTIVFVLESLIFYCSKLLPKLCEKIAGVHAPIPTWYIKVQPQGLLLF